MHPQNKSGIGFLFLCFCLLVIFFNLLKLSVEIPLMNEQRKKAPLSFLGFKFSGLEGALKGVLKIGFMTDKDLSDRRHAAQFAQAQYVLCPIVLDLNNPNHEYLLFDCTSEEAALEKIKETASVPLKRNNFGIVLARKKR